MDIPAWNQERFECVDPECIAFSSRIDREETFELRIVEDNAAIFKQNSSDLPMIFDDVDEALESWVILHEEESVPFTEEEMEMLDVLDIPYCRETGIVRKQ